MGSKDASRRPSRRIWLALLLALGPLIVGVLVLVTLYTAAARSAELPDIPPDTEASRF